MNVIFAWVGWLVCLPVCQYLVKFILILILNCWCFTLIFVLFNEIRAALYLCVKDRIHYIAYVFKCLVFVYIFFLFVVVVAADSLRFLYHLNMIIAEMYWTCYGERKENGDTKKCTQSPITNNNKKKVSTERRRKTTTIKPIRFNKTSLDRAKNSFQEAIQFTLMFYIHIFFARQHIDTFCHPDDIKYIVFHCRDYQCMESHSGYVYRYIIYIYI